MMMIIMMMIMMMVMMMIMIVVNLHHCLGCLHPLHSLSCLYGMCACRFFVFDSWVIWDHILRISAFLYSLSFSSLFSLEKEDPILTLPYLVQAQTDANRADPPPLALQTSLSRQHSTYKYKYKYRKYRNKYRYKYIHKHITKATIYFDWVSLDLMINTWFICM